jgi:CubicO group peptidase (beta-lactamase class C family)
MSARRPVLSALAALAAALIVAPASAAERDLAAPFRAEVARHGVVGAAMVTLKRGAEPVEVFAGEQTKGSGRSVDAQTAWNFASITKTMTAVAILQLRDRGRLSLDDPAVRYVPELARIHDPFGPVDRITVRMLLEHSAGFRNPTWPWDCDNARSCDWQPFEPTRWSQVEAMLPYTGLAFEPGSRWSYSNLAYVFLGQIIERLSGEDFEVYVEKNILRPLDMRESYFDHAPYFLEAHVSSSYLRAGSRLSEQPFNYDTGITTSNSGLKAPVRDMEKYLRFLIGAPGDARYEMVLKRSSLEEMWTGRLEAREPGEPPSAYTTDLGGGPPRMGLGFFTQTAKGRPLVFHDGDQGGFTSEILIDRDRGAGALIVFNTTDTGEPAQTGGADKEPSHAPSNTEPGAGLDPRLSLRKVLVERFFSQGP